MLSVFCLFVFYVSISQYDYVARRSWGLRVHFYHLEYMSAFAFRSPSKCGRHGRHSIPHPWAVMLNISS